MRVSPLASTRTALEPSTPSTVTLPASARTDISPPDSTPVPRLPLRATRSMLPACTRPVVRLVAASMPAALATRVAPAISTNEPLLVTSRLSAPLLVPAPVTLAIWTAPPPSTSIAPASRLPVVTAPPVAVMLITSALRLVSAAVVTPVPPVRLMAPSTSASPLIVTLPPVLVTVSVVAPAAGLAPSTLAMLMLPPVRSAVVTSTLPPLRLPRTTLPLLAEAVMSPVAAVLTAPATSPVRAVSVTAACEVTSRMATSFAGRSIASGSAPAVIATMPSASMPVFTSTPRPPVRVSALLPLTLSWAALRSSPSRTSRAATRLMAPCAVVPRSTTMSRPEFRLIAPALAARLRT